MSASSDSFVPRPPRGEDLPYDDGEPMESEHGRVWCAPIGMHLSVESIPWKGISGPWFRWIDRDGQPLDDAPARAARAEELAVRETKRANREAERARAAEQELARLGEELARRGG